MMSHEGGSHKRRTLIPYNPPPMPFIRNFLPLQGALPPAQPTNRTKTAAAAAGSSMHSSNGGEDVSIALSTNNSDKEVPMACPLGLAAKKQRWNETDVGNFFSILKEFATSSGDKKNTTDNGKGGGGRRLVLCQQHNKGCALRNDVVTQMKKRLRKTERQIQGFHFKMFKLAQKLVDAYGIDSLRSCSTANDPTATATTRPRVNGKEKTEDTTTTAATIVEEVGAATTESATVETNETPRGSEDDSINSKKQPQQKQQQRIVLYLTPRDERTRSLNETCGYTTKLQLSLKRSKSIRAVTKYLEKNKWCNVLTSSPMASIRLVSPLASSSLSWSIRDAKKSTTVESIYERLGCPNPFTLDYVWENKQSEAASSSSTIETTNRTATKLIHTPAAFQLLKDKSSYAHSPTFIRPFVLDEDASLMSGAPAVTPLKCHTHVGGGVSGRDDATSTALTTETSFDRELFNMLAEAGDGLPRLSQPPRQAREVRSGKLAGGGDDDDGDAGVSSGSKDQDHSERNDNTTDVSPSRPASTSRSATTTPPFQSMIENGSDGSGDGSVRSSKANGRDPPNKLSPVAETLKTKATPSKESNTTSTAPTTIRTVPDSRSTPGEKDALYYCGGTAKQPIVSNRLNKKVAAMTTTPVAPHLPGPMPGLHEDGVARARRIAARMCESWNCTSGGRESASDSGAFQTPLPPRPSRRVPLLLVSKAIGAFPNRLRAFDTTPPKSLDVDVTKRASAKALELWSGRPIPESAREVLMFQALEEGGAT
eukprot:g1152.t1